jgi:hypothetical protein
MAEDIGKFFPQPEEVTLGQIFPFLLSNQVHVDINHQL